MVGGDRRFLGYWLGRAFWGRGVGTRALGLFLELEKTRPLYADPFEGNTASVRLLDGVSAGDQEITLRVLRLVRANVHEQENR
ncbi:GNAT family N-acetyltransferase [Nonomuraea rhizosphaerae]|uniref:GNAT family N-acetyltransferase n=1 Tax=Nonomuraea rhizosphaerae TaxID=2665663 RepID=UPI0027E2EDD1|nr:GNAT family protein [Nonomuraea rhizosphaerae]